ncbi:DUF2399 domain-containing protein [Streptomyces sp. A5-4]|uniref:DUF2399 domain-containing protein n=1 Tax=Streptomyces sp. A5-4 TaxID=3384771 RepID=UPI003DA7BBEB
MFEAGGTLMYQGDFYCPGIELAITCARAIGQPLAHEYGGLSRRCQRRQRAHPVGGPRARHRLGSRIGKAMVRENRAMHEEAVADTLLTD